MQTRGRGSENNERVFATTTGNFEASEADIARIAYAAIPELGQEPVKELTVLVNWRITETRSPYLSWGEAEKPVEECIASARAASEAIEAISRLGINPISRPQGEHLLQQLDYDFNNTHAFKPADWQIVSAWLDFVADNIEAQFKPYSGRKKPYYDFILAVDRIIGEAGIQSADSLVPLVDLLVGLNGVYADLVFPPKTVNTRSSRYEYVRNVFRENTK